MSVDLMLREFQSARLVIAETFRWRPTCLQTSSDRLLSVSFFTHSFISVEHHPLPEVVRYFFSIPGSSCILKAPSHFACAQARISKRSVPVFVPTVLVVRPSALSRASMVLRSGHALQNGRPRAHARPRVLVSRELVSSKLLVLLSFEDVVKK